MYKQIGEFQRRGGRRKDFDIVITVNSALRFELDRWLEVRESMNGAPWALHQRITILGAFDTSSTGWGGLIPEKLVLAHINVEEAHALQQPPHRI